jgi:cytochrome c peroxidase
MNNNQVCIFFILVLFFIAGPVFAGPNDLVNLGGAIYKDLNLSLNQNQSCMTCHHPSAGFADPENRISPALFPVSDGSIDTLFGGRNAPEASYSGFSPIFHHDGELFVGGLFWDGRATGRMDITATGELGSGPTGDPLADQAKGPFGNPVEMALPGDNYETTEEAVVGIIQASDYAAKFEKVFGPNAFADIGVAYNNASLAIAAFERSKKLDKFKSKFDKFVQEQGGDVSDYGVEVQADGFRKYKFPPEGGFKSKVYSYDEADGLAIFNSDSYTQMGVDPAGKNGGMCYLCHLTTNHEVVIDDDTRPENGPAPGIYNPLLTDFTYDNLGIPVNPRIAELAGPQDTDLGLGGQVAQLAAACPTCDPTAEEGKFKVSSLRNLSRTAPYGHNGFFATIFDIVHFYNTRDVLSWPPAEVPATVNTDELGNLGLTLKQEQKLVMFLETLND